ncbi:ergothioneine biosynthesis protein EgtB [bacterium]|nr:ergothioneine biosynthesis protein EgtB [bacterium]
MSGSRVELVDRYRSVRARTEDICKPLSAEDHVPQPIMDVSPPKWHLGHVTWFYEQVFLCNQIPRYKPFHKDYAWIFNSYYDSFGLRVERPLRGTLSRPTLEEIHAFRKYVDDQMIDLIQRVDESEWADFADKLMLSLNHEQQHQELLLTDLKFILACNPVRPSYATRDVSSIPSLNLPSARAVSFEGGLFEIGHTGSGCCYDNEGPVHTVHVAPYQLENRLVTNREYLGFVEDGGYERFDHWLSDAWTQVREEEWNAPLYWEKQGEKWHEFTLYGLEPLDPNAPVCHVSYYEADAFAHWAGKRLPLETEWEIAIKQTDATLSADGFYDAGRLHPAALDAESVEADTLQQTFGHCWEWTGSGYLPYPGYTRIEGPFGEYNGKFMINQMVMRGGSIATSCDHFRPTYRNFFKPDKRWQFKGIRLALNT